MNHSVNDEVERVVTGVLKRSLKIAADLFQSTDPLLIMEIHDRLVARAHCCTGTEEDEDEGNSWK